MMNSVWVRPFSAVFDEVPDWRHAKGRRHSLAVILNLVVVALINQQNSLRQIASWARGLDRQTRARLRFRHGRLALRPSGGRCRGSTPRPSLLLSSSGWKKC